jgi:hypothetical protein
MLAQSRPEEAERLLRLAEQDVRERRRTYEALAARTPGPSPAATGRGDAEGLPR